MKQGWISTCHAQLSAVFTISSNFQSCTILLKHDDNSNKTEKHQELNIVTFYNYEVLAKASKRYVNYY